MKHKGEKMKKIKIKGEKRNNGNYIDVKTYKLHARLFHVIQGSLAVILGFWQ